MCLTQRADTTGRWGASRAARYAVKHVSGFEPLRVCSQAKSMPEHCPRTQTALGSLGLRIQGELDFCQMGTFGQNLRTIKLV
jgi:hypothetical protein